MLNSANVMTIIKEKVTHFQKESEEVQHEIVSGSDTHLDLILWLKKMLDPHTERFSKLMDEIIPDSNCLSKEQVRILLPSLLDLYSSSIKLVAALKSSSLAKDISISTKEYYSQVENLREFIYDLEHLRSGNDEDGLDEILHGLNNL